MTTARARSNPRRRSNAVAPLAFRPLASRSLAHALVERLSAEIVSGRLAAGARLPTEQELIASAGVSRTVVREAIAALRAEGLVVTRQGAGAFVADGSRRPFKIEPSEPGSLAEILALMELRTAIEVEAAGLAAERDEPTPHRRRLRSDRPRDYARRIGDQPGLRVPSQHRGRDRQSAVLALS